MRFTMRQALAFIVFAITCSPAFPAAPPGPPPGPPPAPRVMAPVDLTGTWVSVVSEDWRWRMMRPAKGDYTSVPLSPAGKASADTWSPDQAVPSGEECRSYGAPGIMRMPGRVRISWQDDYTLKIETDSGMQTRILQFARPGAPPLTAAPGTPRTWQGFSVAQWEQQGRPVTGGGFFSGGPTPPTTRTLEVTTTHLRAGYLRANGIPFSEDAVVTEFYNLWKATSGEWFTVTTMVRDPQNLRQPFVTTTDFKREPDGSKWDPRPCGS